MQNSTKVTVVAEIKVAGDHDKCGGGGTCGTFNL